MPQPQVNQTQWLALSRETRQKIATLFNMPKSGISDLTFLNGRYELKSDGHTNADLALLTADRMRTLAGSESTDPATLLQAVAEYVNHIEPALVPTFTSPPLPEAPGPIVATSKWTAKDCCGSKGARHLKSCTAVPA